MSVILGIGMMGWQNVWCVWVVRIVWGFQIRMGLIMEVGAIAIPIIHGMDRHAPQTLIVVTYKIRTVLPAWVSKLPSTAQQFPIATGRILEIWPVFVTQDSIGMDPLVCKLALTANYFPIVMGQITGVQPASVTSVSFGM